MRHLLLACSLAALFITSCNDNGGEKKDDKTADNKTAGIDYAASLTDISASKDVKVLLAQNWENTQDVAEATAAGGGASAFEMPYRGFSFFSDGTVVQNPRDVIKFGTWTLDDAGKTVTIIYTNKSKAVYNIVKMDAKLMVIEDLTDKRKMEYRADGKVEKVLADDPFYGTNNQWRIKPAKPESDEAIKARVLGCVNFYVKLLNDEIGRANLSPVIFTGLPPVFNWYDGSITVTNKNKLMDKWVNCFYNKEQALKGQQLLENVITKKYKWDKKAPHWLAKDAPVIKQIYDTLAATK